MINRILISVVLFLGSINVMASEPPKILMLIAEDFNRNEFFEPYFALKSAGYQVDVASYKTGTIQSGSLSFDAELTLEDVNPENYIAMFLPGGHAPENLEKYPRAVDICAYFLKSDQLVTTLCHGPRLLAHTGLLKDRVISYVFRVRDELPWYFMDGRLGQYRDKALVEDGDLITGRYPEDVTGLIVRTFERLADAGGLPHSSVKPDILIVDGGISKEEGYGYLMGGLKSQANVVSTRPDKLESFLQKEGYHPDDFDMLVLLEGKDTEDLLNHPDFDTLIRDFKSKPVAATHMIYKAIKKHKQKIRLDQGIPGNIGIIVQRSLKVADKKVKQEVQEIDAVIAIEPDFDESVFYAVKGWMQYKGMHPVIVSSKKGRIRSMNGLIVLSDYDYATCPELKKDALILDPGGLWPDRRDYRKNELDHYDWLISKWKQGANLVAFGFGSYHLGLRSEFKDMPIASSDQVVWSFNKKGGGKYSKDSAVLTTERFITVKGPVAMGEGLRLMESVLQDE